MKIKKNGFFKIYTLYSGVAKKGKKKKGNRVFFFFYYFLLDQGLLARFLQRNTGAIKLLRAMKIFQSFPPFFLRGKNHG